MGAWISETAAYGVLSFGYVFHQYNQLISMPLNIMVHHSIARFAPCLVDYTVLMVLMVFRTISQYLQFELIYQYQRTHLYTMPSIIIIRIRHGLSQRAKKNLKNANTCQMYFVTLFLIHPIHQMMAHWNLLLLFTKVYLLNIQRFLIFIFFI